jgi:hypothetical protein
MRWASVPGRLVRIGGAASMMARSCGLVSSSSFSNEPQLDLSDGISVLASHLPFRLAKKSSCGARTHSMYWPGDAGAQGWGLGGEAAAPASMRFSVVTLSSHVRSNMFDMYRQVSGQ